MHGTTSRSVFNNHLLSDKRIGLSTIAALPLTRHFSSIRSLVNNSEALASDHINSGKPTTLSVINKVLLNQNLVVTDSKLKELLKVEGVEIELPISTPKGKELLAELTGKSKYKGFSGVYMFIHKNTGDKYVGSSNLLRRRMDYYFNGDYPLAGKFLPLLYKEGLEAFKLRIFKLDSNKFSSQDALILEQFYLLDKEFNLNTLRVVNAGSSKGDPVYVYDLTCSILYYYAKSRIELKRVLNIHTETSKKYVDSKLPYLNKFLLLSYPIPTALTSDISLEELLGIMQDERKDTYKLGTRTSIPVELEIKEGNTFVSEASKGHTLKFDSLTSCMEYLRGLGLIIKRDTLTKYIKIEKVFHNFLCKYSDKTLPKNFDEIGLIIDEYKKLKVDTDSLIINRKNKPILVKGGAKLHMDKEFDSITEAIKHFDNLNIKLDSKTLYLRLKDGKIYKDYYFTYK
uniref:GIY-YIG endonuclease n=1 Tax=Fusarium cortaderiae TaxID=281068 RepID=UPI0020283CEC|nr:GIY-YIG endonuclease [Fusarium cortaderiae]UPX01389.1 GIY-YIG endonuclease [Fusarium austroamericanum]UPX01710.1 GIY-YIG endonuclease [Fusarium cortaderiae]UPX01761.1 GIY-YIG endonuclease [Fusarium cortaderiae]